LTIVCKILSRIVERYLDINNLTVQQVLKVLDDSSAKKPDALTLRVERARDEWDKKTQIALGSVLDA
jgi:hypothetical protein